LQFFLWGRKKGPVVLKRSPAREPRKGAQLCILPISLVMLMMLILDGDGHQVGVSEHF
jgi:hypothetical protein